MSAEIVQFVSKANYGRSPAMDTLPSLRADNEARAFELAAREGWKNPIDTAPSEYVSDSGDCA
jgi:hypothetical protein